MCPAGNSTTPSSAQISVDDGEIVFAGEKVSYLRLPDRGYDSSWLSRQVNSIDEYKLTHVEEVADEHSNQLYTLFGHFLNSAVLHVISSQSDSFRPNILDVGCGIYNARPPYVTSSSEDVSNYYGLDPLDINFTSRSYPFFLGDLTQLADQVNLKSQFDIFVFATSLDHIEDLDKTRSEIYKLASPSAAVVFWCGLRDPELAGEHNGSLVFNKVLSGRVATGYLLYCIYGILRLPRLLFRTARTRYRLRRGIPLDDLHERYFTSGSLEAIVQEFGTITSSVRIPGSNSVFYCVSLHDGLSV
jgi:hypothetical protein